MTSGQEWQSWSLKKKIGQLFVFGFHGFEPSEPIKQLIEANGIGGTIYFTRNVKDAQQVHRLSTELQSIAKQAGNPPLFIAIDQEGGMVARLVEGVTLMPGNMALGAAGLAEGAMETARVCGEELRQLGITMNYAPCIDVNNNPDNPVINVRSYSDRSSVVAELGAAAVAGYQAAGVAATVKHFPGHGDTAVDSHHALPILQHGRERLEAIELKPFRAAIEAGTDCIMTAHVCLPALDATGVPSTLSKPILTGLLRTELGYNGVVVTDCLEMDAIDKTYGPEQGAIKALQAGADMVLISHTFEKQRSALEAVAAAVESGELEESRINEALDRVMTLKEKRKLDEALQPWSQVESIIGTEANKAVASKWSEASVTLVKNDDGLLPLSRGESTLVLWPEIVPVSVADEMLSGDGSLGYFLQELGANVVERLMNEPNPLADLEQFSQIVVVTYDASKHQVEREIAREAVRLAPERTVAVSVRNPLDLLLYPQVKGYMAVYECRPLALAAAAKALLGDLVPKGKLPLEISAAYPFGWSAEGSR
ncbi:beta-N-acetylhexosaminidase [Paenibacillus endophyticus]|uniref:Beta-N-acetylhexosaminidase n=1 Tax=Paenibacillus endophyticus TaxID=1294268 RepID=A0A7W5CDN4_9BACL|nr:glycoside hydrolase family 3 protein [Paenibacillus endophyticus]MBB3154939.1 beta-N-acetylhexosaminidase [Paenibacillus endophyticus]